VQLYPAHCFSIAEDPVYELCATRIVLISFSANCLDLHEASLQSLKFRNNLSQSNLYKVSNMCIEFILHDMVVCFVVLQSSTHVIHAAK
jgi:hypothetical protein